MSEVIRKLRRRWSGTLPCFGFGSWFRYQLILILIDSNIVNVSDRNRVSCNHLRKRKMINKCCRIINITYSVIFFQSILHPGVNISYVSQSTTQPESLSDQTLHLTLPQQQLSLNMVTEVSTSLQLITDHCSDCLTAGHLGHTHQESCAEYYAGVQLSISEHNNDKIIFIQCLLLVKKKDCRIIFLHRFHY